MLMGPVFRAELLRTGRQQPLLHAASVLRPGPADAGLDVVRAVAMAADGDPHGGHHGVRRHDIHGVRGLAVDHGARAGPGRLRRGDRRREAAEDAALHHGQRPLERRDHPRQGVWPRIAPGPVRGDRAARRMHAGLVRRDFGRVRDCRLRRNVLERVVRGGTDGPGVDLGPARTRRRRHLLSPGAELAAGAASHPCVRLGHPSPTVLLD